jgi:hypothetical protein
MPMRDENGNWAVIIEFRPATSPLVHERFAELARTLYQKWVVEPPPFPREPKLTPPAPPIYGVVGSVSSPIASTPSLPSEADHV